MNCTAQVTGQHRSDKARKECPSCSPRVTPGNMKRKLSPVISSGIPPLDEQMKSVIFHGGNSDPDAPQVIITVGLPASGKTTFANMWVAEDPENRVNVNRDDAREFIGIDIRKNGIGTPEEEATVTQINLAKMKGAIREGKDVIVSDTNLRSQSVGGMLEELLPDVGVSSKVFNVDFDELLRRDRERMAKGERGVGETILRKIHKSFQKAPNFDNLVKKKMLWHEGASWAPYPNNPNNPAAILVDIDGTVAHTNGKRSPYDYTKVHVDDVDEMVRATVISAHTSGRKVIFMSGREDSCREETAAWLDKYNIPHDELHMRATKDMRPDWVIKDELVREHVFPKHYVEYALDDRNQVVDHHRRMGMKVLQVQPGDF